MATRDGNDASDDLLANLGWVRRLALALARDPDTADDLMQQAAGAWLAGRPAWAERGSGLRRWLARVVRGRAIDHFRAERARVRREQALPPPGPAETAGAVVARLEQQRRVAAAVHALDEPYRTTILYRYLEERPTHEVAQLTGVPEATARKRIERGLELLRARLSAEFGTPPRSWALTLLEPSLRGAVAPAAKTAVSATLWFGATLVSTKIVVAISALAAAVALAWWLPDRGTAAPTPAGSTGVIASHEATTATGTSPGARPADVTRTPVGAPDAVVAAPGGLRLGGHVLVDGERRAPADLAIEVADDAGTARCDSTQATWTFEAAAAAGPPFSLWITSATTAPTRMAVPAEAFAAATFDLALTTGRTLALTFVDHRTRAPLADLPFEVDKSLELERTGGRVMMRSAQSRHRTDAEGRATVTGVPTIGAVAVRTDLVTRERRLRLRGGKTIPLHRPGPSIWSELVTKASPMRIEVTIATEPVLGEAFAAGAVPAWARPRDGRGSCRVFARQLARHDSRDDDACELACSDTGEFSLRASAPSRHAVWLEGPDGRQRLSAETIVAFDHAGAHAPILFEPLAKTAVRLRCTGLPPVGMLTASVAGDRSPARSEAHACTGGSRDFELELASGETVQLRLRAADGDARGETGYLRRLTAAEVQGGDVAIDLRGDFRDLVLPADTPGVAGLVGIALCAVRDGNADTRQMAVVPCRDGRAAEAVFLPEGRWFWRGVGQGPFLLCGVVDVRTGDDGPLALTAATQQVPATELRTPCQLDEVDGVSLRALPGSLRAVPAAGEAATVGMPRRGAWSAVTGR